MPLQNRVHPLGEIVAVAERGRFMGNRGGRLHLDDKTLGARRWASKAWICCVTAFRDRRRDVMGDGYTELFFLDEATALASGHRPCFECRRHDATAFAMAWARDKNLLTPPKAGEMDSTLHEERLARRRSKIGRRRLAVGRVGELPNGAMILLWGGVWLVSEHYLLRWSFRGYGDAVDRTGAADAEALVITPPSIIGVLRAGYIPKVDSPLFTA